MIPGYKVIHHKPINFRDGKVSLREFHDMAGINLEIEEEKMIPKLLDSMTLRQPAFMDKCPRSSVSRFHKTSFKRFKVSKTASGKFKIERVK